MGLIEENGGRHGCYSFRLSEMFAEFLIASVRLRLDEQGRLRPVRPEDGVLIDAQMESPRFPPARPGEFKGKPQEALWLPSMDLALAVEKFNRAQFGRKSRDFAFVADNATGALMDNAQGEIKPQWVGPDEFEVQARALDGKEAPIRFLVSCRQMEPTAPNRFRFRFDPRAARWPVLLAVWDGDDDFRYIERVKRVALPWKRGGGSGAWDIPATDRNAITFDTPEKVSRADFPLKLDAASTSKLPVRFTVEYGPARLVGGNTFEIAEWPAKARCPLTISVWAWQLGSQVDPKVPPARPVRRLIVVEP